MAAQPKRPTSNKEMLANLKKQQAQMKHPGLLPVAPKLSTGQRKSVAASPLSAAQKARLAGMRAQYRAHFGS